MRYWLCIDIKNFIFKNSWYNPKPSKRQQLEGALKLYEDLCAKVRAAKGLLINIRTVDLKNYLMQGLRPLIHSISAYKYPSDLDCQALHNLIMLMSCVDNDADLALINQTIIRHFDETILRDLNQNCIDIRARLDTLAKE